MAFETNAEEVKNLAFHPVGAEPNENQGIDDRPLATDAGAQAQAIDTFDGDEGIIEFEARLYREAINTSGIAEEIEIQGGIVATLERGLSQEVIGDHDGGFAPIFDDI